jgi:hypothetical protein
MSLYKLSKPSRANEISSVEQPFLGTFPNRNIYDAHQHGITLGHPSFDQDALELFLDRIPMPDLPAQDLTHYFGDLAQV